MPEPLSAGAFFAAWPALAAAAAVTARPRAGSVSGATASASALESLVAGADAARASLAHVLAADAPGAPGAGVAAYGARTWAGEPLLLLLTSAPPRGAATLEARSPRPSLAAALSSDAAGWIADLSGGACELCDAHADAGEEADAAARDADESDDDADWPGLPAAAAAAAQAGVAW